MGDFAHHATLILGCLEVGEQRERSSDVDRHKDREADESDDAEHPVGCRDENDGPDEQKRGARCIRQRCQHERSGLGVDFADRQQVPG